jgi:arylsulfatase A-like enzyme
LKGLCKRTDRPAAALVKDLKARGLLESTIVLWTGEFGRLPISQGDDGRDHNRHAFSLWLAGGGFRRGCVHGATDDFSYRAVEKIVTVHDLHATLLHALGLDHHALTAPHDGRDTSLTDAEVTGAQVMTELFA